MCALWNSDAILRSSSGNYRRMHGLCNQQTAVMLRWLKTAPLIRWS